jgi:hypothetical protein
MHPCMHACVRAACARLLAAMHPCMHACCMRPSAGCQQPCMQCLPARDAAPVVQLSCSQHEELLMTCLSAAEGSWLPHHITLLDVSALVQQILHAGEVPCPELNLFRWNPFSKHVCMVRRRLCQLGRKALPLPAASSRGGSPQWSDSLRGAPCMPCCFPLSGKSGRAGLGLHESQSSPCSPPRCVPSPSRSTHPHSPARCWTSPG